MGIVDVKNPKAVENIKEQIKECTDQAHCKIITDTHKFTMMACVIQGTTHINSH